MLAVEAVFSQHTLTRVPPCTEMPFEPQQFFTVKRYSSPQRCNSRRRTPGPISRRQGTHLEAADTGKKKIGEVVASLFQEECEQLPGPFLAATSGVLRTCS